MIKLPAYVEGRRRIPDFVLAALATALALLVAWSCDRGFDLLDESHYLLDALNPADTLVGATAAARFLKPVFAALRYDVAMFRLAGLAFLLLSTLFLTLRVRHLLVNLAGGRLSPSILSLAAMASLGCLLYYFWFIRSPGYNLLIVAGCYLFTGLFLWALEAEPGTRAFWVRTAATGVLWSFCLLIKFPSAVALLGLSAIAFLVWHKWSWRSAGLFAACFAAAAAISLVLYFIFAETPESWIARVWGMAQFLQSPGFKSSPAGNLVRYMSQSVRGLIDAIKVFWPAFVIMLAALATALATRDINKARRRIAIGFLVALFLLGSLAIRAGFYGWQFTQQDLFYFYFLATALVLMTIAGAAFASRRLGTSAMKPLGCQRLAVVLVLLFMVPIAAAFGTGNQITTNALLAMAPWFIGTTILAAVLSGQILLGGIGPAVMLTLGAMAFADVVSGARQPYGIYATIFAQTEPTELGLSGHSLKLDPATSSYVKDIRDLANRGGITAKSDVLFFYDSPGSVFAIGAHSPGVPWFFSESPASTAFVLARLSRERLQHAYFMIDLQTPPPPSLSMLGLKFPEDYELVGEVLRRPIQHHIQLWRPRVP